MYTSGEYTLPPLAIAMFPCDNFGCGFYRMRLPARVLAENGHAVHVYDNYEFPNPNERPYDIYHFQRITNPKGLNAIRAAIKTGKPVLMDLDDDLYNLFPGHPSSWYFKSANECKRCGNTNIHQNETVCPNCKGTDLEFQDRLGDCTRGIQEVDAITVSTEELGERFKFGAKRVELMRNYVDMSNFDRLVRKGDYNIVVGWAGSFAHNLDIGIIRNTISIIEEFENVYFAVVGVDPEVITNNFSSAFKDPERMITMDPMPVERYPEILAAFDIGLAPIHDHLFNKCKSELKAEEYGAAHVPIICSNVAPYIRYVEHGKDGFIARKDKEWKKYLRLLLNNPQMIKDMGNYAYQKSSAMDIRKNIRLRETVYYELAMEKGIIPVWVLLQQQEQQKPKPSPFSIVGGKL